MHGIPTVYAWHMHRIPGPPQAHPRGRRAHLLLGFVGSGAANHRPYVLSPSLSLSLSLSLPLTSTPNPNQVRQTIDAETIEMIEFVPWEDVPLRYPALFGDALGARTLKEAMGNRDPACVAAKTWTTFFAEE